MDRRKRGTKVLAVHPGEQTWVVISQRPQPYFRSLHFSWGLFPHPKCPKASNRNKILWLPGVGWDHWLRGGAGSRAEVWAHPEQTINLPNQYLLTRKWLLGELLGVWNYPIYFFCHSLFFFFSWPKILVRSLEKKRSSELSASSGDGETAGGQLEGNGPVPGIRGRNQRALQEADSQAGRSELGGSGGHALEAQFRWSGLFIVIEFYRVTEESWPQNSCTSFPGCPVSSLSCPWRSWVVLPLMFLLSHPLVTQCFWFIIPSLPFGV